MTICKGNCFVVTKIKMISSENQEKKSEKPAIDFTKINDIISDYTVSFEKSVTVANVQFYLPVILHVSKAKLHSLLKPPMV